MHQQAIADRPPAFATAALGLRGPDCVIHALRMEGVDLAAPRRRGTMGPMPASSSDVVVRSVNGRGQTEYMPGTSDGPRVLTDFQLVIVLAGQARWTSGGDDYEVVPGDAWLSPPGVQEHLAILGDRPMLTVFAHLDLRRADGSPCEASTWPRMRRLPADDVLRPLLRHLIWLADTAPAGWEELARSAGRHLILAFLSGQAATGGVVMKPLPRPVAAALAHLRTCWRGRDVLHPVPVAAMALAAGVSREHLTREFRRTYGESPAGIERRFRLDRAVELLTTTNLDIGVIAGRCGWSDIGHFSRRFRAHYGSSPRAMRTSARSGLGGRTYSPARLQGLTEQVSL